MIYHYGGFALMPNYIHLMLLLGIVMIVIFTYVFFSCYVRFSLLVEAKEWPKAGEMLATIRKLVALNLAIGLLTVGVVVFGRG
jgi:uncharacterized membrane protein